MVVVAAVTIDRSISLVMLLDTGGMERRWVLLEDMGEATVVVMVVATAWEHRWEEATEWEHRWEEATAGAWAWEAEEDDDPEWVMQALLHSELVVVC